LDYTPRDIHERSEALFGTTLPCQEDGDCEYTEGWDRVSDPDNEIDLLIGHYTHANVESARTHYSRGIQGRTEKSPRTLIIDEFPGLTYADEFDTDVKDHITWLAGALADDVDDFQDLLEQDLWQDEFIQAWLAGEADNEDSPAREIVRTLGAREDIHRAVEQAEFFLDEYPDLLAEHDLADPLKQLVDEYPDVDNELRSAVAGDIRSTAAMLPGDAPGFNILQWLDDDVADPLIRTSGISLDIDMTAVPGGDELAELVERAIEAADAREDSATGLLEGARTALTGGDRGARELAVWSDHGYAHREAHYLLEAALAPEADNDRDVTQVQTEEYTFGADEATLKYVTVGESNHATVILDRDYNGAGVLAPPGRSAAGGTCPLIGLDATARRDLWELVIGEDVTIEDIHDTPEERAEALRELHNLQVIQTTTDIKSYEGDPSGKNLDADVALLEEIVDRFTGVHVGRGRDEDNVLLGKPAVITTKVVRQVLEGDNRAAEAVNTWENYGNLKGSNELAGHHLGVLLGCQHFGDREVEKMAAFAGEEITRNGYGTALDYDSGIANTYLKHMREDQVMQAILRFARDERGALVFAHTAALRKDLPVVGEGQVIKSWSETAAKIARAWRRQPTEEFTISDVADAADVSRRQVRRVLSEFVDAGYLQRHDPGEGLANEYTPVDDPGAGEVDIDEVSPVLGDEPGQTDLEVTYTMNVRVTGVNSDQIPHALGRGSTLPAPGNKSYTTEAIEQVDGPPNSG